MKIRIDSNTIKVRLNRLEVSEFNSTNRLVDETKFGLNNTLRYLLVKDNGDHIRVHFDGRIITIKIPSERVVKWVEDDSLIAIEEEVQTSDNLVHIVIEKDLKRLSKHHKANSNSFPNPLARTAKFE